MEDLKLSFGKGKESTEGGSIKRYIGVAPVYVLAVNPNKEELEKIYNTNLEKEPEYLGETELDNSGTKYKVPQIRVDFIVRTDAERSNGIDMTTKVSFFIAKEVRYNKDRTKVQVINDYGETTWLTIEDAKNGVVPENLSWFEPANFRPAYIGEEDLIKFIKAYLGIPNKSYRKSTGEVIELEDKSEAIARLNYINEYFKGDIRELKTIISFQPNNKVKCLFGVKTSGDNRLYQDVYTRKFMKNNLSDYSYLDADVTNNQNNGAYPNTVFETCDLKEYSLEPTTFDSEDNGDLPFAPSEESNPWFK